MRLDALFARRTAGIRPGLDHLRLPYAILGRPCSGLAAIHIVGTNGKGSTAAMCEAALLAHGRRVGLFTSPHLVEVNERIRVLGEPVTDEALQAAVDAVLATETGQGPRELSFFEVLTLAALLVFEQAKLDIIVVEAGLGGRLDATRLVDAQAVVVTSIALDHQQWLGDTVEAIAREKAGVFRPDVPVFAGPVAPNVAAVLRECAAARNSPYCPVLPLASAPPGLPGQHQRANAALALAAVSEVCPGVDEKDLDATAWPARLERIEMERSQVWLDAGHNPSAIEAVVDSLKGRLDPRRTVVVFGCTTDRPAGPMMATLSVLGRMWWVPVDAADERTAELCFERSFDGPDDAALLTALYERVRRSDTILIVGSHRLVGPLRQWAVGGDTHIDPSDPRHAAL